MLAPSFGGENFVQSYQACRLFRDRVMGRRHHESGAFIGWLVMLVAFIYTLYTFYLGAPVLKKCSQEKAVVYTIVVLVCAIVVGAIFRLLIASLLFIGRCADWV